MLGDALGKDEALMTGDEGLEFRCLVGGDGGAEAGRLEFGTGLVGVEEAGKEVELLMSGDVGTLIGCLDCGGEVVMGEDFGAAGEIGDGAVGVNADVASVGARGAGPGSGGVS